MFEQDLYVRTLQSCALCLYPSWVLHTAHSVCHTEHTDLSLTNKSGTGMMDSDLVMTCSLPSLLVCHQLAYLSINWGHDFHAPQIIYRLSSQLIQPLQLSIIYHNHCALPLGRLPVSLSMPTPFWIIFPSQRQNYKVPLHSLLFFSPSSLPSFLPWI